METETKQYMEGFELEEIFEKEGFLVYLHSNDRVFSFKLLDKDNKIQFYLYTKPDGVLFSYRDGGGIELKTSFIKSVKIQKPIFIPQEYVWQKVAEAIAEKNGNIGVSYKKDDSLGDFFECECDNVEKVKNVLQELGNMGFDLESAVRKEIRRLTP